MNFELQLSQKQGLSQQQIQSLNLLALSNAELSSYMENEYLENPLLEKADTQAEARVNDSSALYRAVSPADEDTAMPETAERKTTSLPDLLLSQLDLRHYSETEQAIFAYLTENLDSRGFLPLSLSEAAEQLHVSIEEAGKCLRILQTLEPAGIFAGSLEECLLLQLRRKGICTEELEQIVLHHLQDLAVGHYNVISRNLHISTVAVRKAAAVIAAQNPNPLQGYDDGETHYIVPDIIIRKSENDRQKNWEISLNRENLRLYQLSDFYLHMMADSRDQELSAYFEQKLAHARLLLKAVEQREKTILSVTQAILQRQNDYFHCGRALRPMTMQDIAYDCGTHVSTVSRAVKDKYLQYPGGTVLMKALFTAVHTEFAAETEASPEEIKEKITELISTENPQLPYSDQKLTELLSAEGFPISRRTTAKYRSALGIAPASVRKQI